MARRPTARAPAAPARTFTTRATSPSASAFRIMSSTTRTRFRETVIDTLRRELLARRDAGAVHRVQPIGQVRATCSTPRASSARRRSPPAIMSLRVELGDGSRALLCAADVDRDQSYFLFATTREQLDYLRFPLGDMTKPEVRELRARFGLTVADKHDSQDICFVPNGRYTDVIERLKPNAVGAGRDRRISTAACSAAITASSHFTVGQRTRTRHRVRRAALRGAARRRRRAASWSVRARRCGCDRIALRDVNWIGDGALDRAIGGGLEIFVRVRSTRAPQPALAARRRRPLRSRARRGRGGRLARTGLRVLRRGLGPGARARRRLHRQSAAATRVHQATRPLAEAVRG